MRVKEAKIFYISGDRLDKFPARIGPSRGTLAKVAASSLPVVFFRLTFVGLR